MTFFLISCEQFGMRGFPFLGTNVAGDEELAV